MVSWFNWDDAKLVVEFGPGTGAFTGEVLRCRKPSTHFFAIEQNEDFARHLRAKFPAVQTYCDTIVNTGRLCQQEGFSATESVDGIVCGLPWAAFGQTLQDELLRATLAAMRPGGQFATFAYVQGTAMPAGIRFRRKLDASFKNVEKSPIVWRNLPPAFIYRCTK